MTSSAFNSRECRSGSGKICAPIQCIELGALGLTSFSGNAVPSIHRTGAGFSTRLLETVLPTLLVRLGAASQGCSLTPILGVGSSRIILQTVAVTRHGDW